jgi:nitroreductase
MEILNAIKKRYSCRKYESKPIEQEKLDTVLEAARLAPSAKNIQDWRFVVSTAPEVKSKLAEAANNQTFLAEAGAVITGCSVSDYKMRCGQAIAPIDIAIAMEHIALQASELGLATCWIGSFYPEKVRDVLDIPSEIEVVELMALGYPADTFSPPKRVPQEEIFSYNKWDFKNPV